MDAVGRALILRVEPKGERDALVVALCPEIGKFRGYVKGRKVWERLQPLDEFQYERFRRLDSQLGSLTVEVLRSRAALWLGGARLPLLVVNWLRELLDSVLVEEHPYPVVYAAVDMLLERVIRVGWEREGWRDVVDFERFLLGQAGYGISLMDSPVACASGSAYVYVSPTSGRAVSAAMGQAYAERMLALPHLWGGPEVAERVDVTQAFQLTGFFLNKAAHGRTLEARDRLVRYLVNS